MDALERIIRQWLPVPLLTGGNSCTTGGKSRQEKPAISAQRTGSHCLLSVSDQLLDQLSKIRVIFSEKDRSRFHSPVIKGSGR